MKKLISLAIIPTFILVGCSQNQDYDSAYAEEDSAQMIENQSDFINQDDSNSGMSPIAAGATGAAVGAAAGYMAGRASNNQSYNNSVRSYTSATPTASVSRGGFGGSAVSSGG